MTLQPKQSSPLTQFFSFENYLQRIQHKLKSKSAAIAFFSSSLPFFLLALSIFNFLVFFQEDFRIHIAFGFLVFFSVNRLQFSFGTFSMIQQDNALAFTPLTYQHPQIYKFQFFEAFHFLLDKVNWREGEDRFTNSLRCTTTATMQSC